MQLSTKLLISRTVETPTFVNSPSELIHRFGVQEIRINHGRIFALDVFLFLEEF